MQQLPLEFFLVLLHVVGEVETPEEVLLVELLKPQPGSLEVDKDRGEEVVVHLVVTLVPLHEQSDPVGGEKRHELVQLPHGDAYDAVLAIPRLRVQLPGLSYFDIVQHSGLPHFYIVDSDIILKCK